MLHISLDKAKSYSYPLINTSVINIVKDLCRQIRTVKLGIFQLRNLAIKVKLHLPWRFIVSAIHKLIFQYAPEAFYWSVVETVAFTTHWACQLMLRDSLVVGMATLLTASVRILNRLSAGSSIFNFPIVFCYTIIDGLSNQLFSFVIAWDIKNYRMGSVAGKVVLK